MFWFCTKPTTTTTTTRTITNYHSIIQLNNIVFILQFPLHLCIRIVQILLHFADGLDLLSFSLINIIFFISLFLPFLGLSVCLSIYLSLLSLRVYVFIYHMYFTCMFSYVLQMSFDHQRWIWPKTSFERVLTTFAYPAPSASIVRNSSPSANPSSYHISFSSSSSFRCYLSFHFCPNVRFLTNAVRYVHSIWLCVVAFQQNLIIYLRK